ncbi:MAG: hypothetical protein IJZ50_02415 [Alistipes sp.]|nr:hypothetical protein [Alistipes sp.]
MKKSLLYLFALVAFAACNPNEKPEVDKPTPPEPEKQAIEIVVNQERLTAFQVGYSIYPNDKEAIYYFEVMSKARWATADVAAIKAELEESLQSFADMTGATYEEVLEQMLQKGDLVDYVDIAGYRGDTDYVIFAFYWDGDISDVSIAEFSTPAPVPSTESIEIAFSDIDPYAMTVSCTPSEGITDYYYYFAETTKADAMLAELEDDNAFMSYHAMNVGTKKSGEQSMEQKGLKPETSYTVMVMGIDDKGNRMQARKECSTEMVQQSERVESELFETLVGEWSGTQTIYDGFAEPEVSEFAVTIVQSVEDYDYDYRSCNQLVALVDGWCRIPYYGIQGLVDSEIENPEDKFGPKWILDIAEGDKVTIDGYARHSTIGWMFMGDCFLVSADADSQNINVASTLSVDVSADGNTLTISSPVEDCYPSLVYFFEGFGWMSYYYGQSDIVLTRK